MQLFVGSDLFCWVNGNWTCHVLTKSSIFCPGTSRNKERAVSRLLPPTHTHPAAREHRRRAVGCSQGSSAPPNPVPARAKHLISCICSTPWWNKEFIFDGEEVNTGDIRWVSVRSASLWKGLRGLEITEKYLTLTFLPAAFLLCELLSFSPQSGNTRKVSPRWLFQERTFGFSSKRF